MIELNDLLLKVGIDPKDVMVMRHRPTERALREVLPWLAAERPEVYNAYQSAHGEVVEAALAKASHLVSFIGHEPRKAVFAGLYAVNGSKRISVSRFWKIPANATLRTLGTRGPKDDRDSLWFDLAPSSQLEELKGRLVIEWTGIERSWWRWASRNTLPVRAIHEESLLVKVMPEWQSLVLEWRELGLLPVSWKHALSHWRGIYFIYDKASRLGYVGSAYGEENIMGRWTGYAATGHGGNRLLRDRDPEHFVFSILQRVSPDMTPDEIVALESSWKDRLQTRSPFGLNDN